MSRRRSSKAKSKPTPSAEVTTRDEAASSFRVVCLVLAVAVVLTLVAHWPAMHAKALSFDDAEYLVGNPLVHHPSWESAQRFVTEVLEPSTVHGYYQPLSMITLMLDRAMGGRNDKLMPFHRTSLLLHVARAY